MKITANETEFDIEENCSLPCFLETLGHKVGLVVVERNREALSPSEASHTILEDGDKLEIVKIVAGG